MYACFLLEFAFFFKFEHNFFLCFETRNPNSQNELAPLLETCKVYLVAVNGICNINESFFFQNHIHLFHTKFKLNLYP